MSYKPGTFLWTLSWWWEESYPHLTLIIIIQIIVGVHGVAKSQIRLSNFTFTFYFHALEEEMATHSSVLSWRIPWTEEPGGLPSMGSHRVGHDWSDLAAAAKSLLMKVKEKTEKAVLKLNIQKTKIMASGPITSWQIDGETVKSVRLYFLGSKITADGDCSHEIKRRLLLGGLP